jgi:putative hydrolase of the HAD superfamily
MSVKVVSFDLWGTLLSYGDRDAEASWRLREFQLVLSECGYMINPNDLRAAVTAVRQETFERQRSDGEQVPAREQVDDIMCRLGIADPALTDLLLIPHCHAVLRACPEPFEGAAQAVAAVRADGRQVVLTSNNLATPAEVTRVLLRQATLDRLFDHEFFSSELGLAKPRAEVFQAISARTGASLGDIVHIGNSWRTDVQAALDAGCAAIWFNGRCLPARPSVPEIRHLSEAPDAVNSLYLSSGRVCTLAAGRSRTSEQEAAG